MDRAERRRLEREETKRVEQLNTYLRTGLLPKIKEYGWAVQHVMADPEGTVPPFTYTVGLTGFGLPEVIMFAMPPDAAHTLLNRMAAEATFAGLALASGTVLTDWLSGGYELTLVDVKDPTEHLTMACYVYEREDRPVRAVQAVWQDKEHRYPWEDGFDPGIDVKVPLLGDPP